MTEFTTHYFHVSSTGEEVAGPVPDAIYAVGDAVFLDNLKGADKRGTWVRITGKRSIVHNAKRANVHWDVEVAAKPGADGNH